VCQCGSAGTAFFTACDAGGTRLVVDNANLQTTVPTLVDPQKRAEGEIEGEITELHVLRGASLELEQEAIEPTHEALMRRPPSRMDNAPPIDRIVMSSLRMVANHAGVPLSDVEHAYRSFDGPAGAFAAVFCAEFADRLSAPMNDVVHVSSVYFPEGIPSRAERRYRLMALHSRIHINDVVEALSMCEDRDSRSRDADLSVFSAFIATCAARLPANFPPLQELLEML
jgi:hypothetical protein